MPNPTGRHSSSRRDKRRTHWKVFAPNMVECSHCHNTRMQHRVCPHCGFYNGKEIFKVEAK